MRLIRDRPRSVELDEFLARPLFAHLATVVDGSPRESPVWFLWEHNALWIIGFRAGEAAWDARFRHTLADRDRNVFVIALSRAPGCRRGSTRSSSWNTVYAQLATDQLRAKGQLITNTELETISPLQHAHGEYPIDPRSRPVGYYRLLRQPPQRERTDRPTSDRV